MEFHGLHRRTLQSLCKKNNIPANLTNAAMAEALSSLPTVIGVDEAQEETLRTPTSKPTSLRPPNPPRSCRKSSVLPLLQEASFPKKNKDFPTSLSSAGVKRRRTAGLLLFPCSEQHISDEMPVRKDNSEGMEHAVSLLEEMCEGNGYVQMKKDVKEETASELDAEAAVMQRSLGSRNVEFYVSQEEGEDMAAEMTRGEKEAEQRGCGQQGDLTRASTDHFNEAVKESSPLQNVEFVSKYVDAEMTKDKKGGNCLDEESAVVEDHLILASRDYRDETVTTPISLQLVAGQGLKDVDYVSEYEDAKIMKDKKGGNCLDETVAIFEDHLFRANGDCRYEAVTTPSSMQLVAEQGSKNVEFVSEDKDAKTGEDKKVHIEETIAMAEDECLKNDFVFASKEMVVREGGEEERGEETNGESFAKTGEDKKDHIEETVAMAEDECLKNDFVFASKEMVAREGGEEERGEETNRESFDWRSELTCLDEVVRVPCSQESVSVLKDQEGELLQGVTLGGVQSDEQEQGLKYDGMLHDVREAGEEGSKHANVSCEKLCTSEERSEDKDVSMMKYMKLGDENSVSFSENIDLISASGGCLDKVVRLMSSQESVNTVKGQESMLLQSLSLGPLVPVEPDQHLKDDGTHKVLRGEIKEQSLNNPESESEEILISEEIREDMDSKMKNDLGSVEQGQGLDNDEGHQVQRGEVADQTLKNNADCESKEMLGSRQRSEIMDCEMRNGLQSNKQEQGLKDDEVHPVLEEEMEDQSLNNMDFESGKISKDTDAETMIDNKGEEKTENNGAIQIGASDSKNHVGEVRLPANSDQDSPFDSEAKNPTLANISCASKTISLPKDQECGSPQQAGEEIEQGLQNMLAENYEKTEAENSRRVGIQVNIVPLDSEVEDEIGIRKIRPELGDTVGSPIVESNSGIKISILEGEGKKRKFIDFEGTGSGKGDKEVATAKMSVNKWSVKKADMRCLSLRKLKVLYKEKKQVGKLEMENNMEGKTESGGTKTKDEFEERSVEKTKLNGLSLRQLKQMYKHKVANNSVAEA